MRVHIFRSRSGAKVATAKLVMLAGKCQTGALG